MILKTRNAWSDRIVLEENLVETWRAITDLLENIKVTNRTFFGGRT